MSEAHDTDVVEWSQRQSTLLRRVAAGEKVNETPDWANIIEEIEDLGANAIRAVRSHLLQAMLHELKIRAWPGSRDEPHWRGEVRLRRGQAADDFTPSMRRQIDVASIYHRALRSTRHDCRPTACATSLNLYLVIVGLAGRSRSTVSRMRYRCPNWWFADSPLTGETRK